MKISNEWITGSEYALSNRVSLSVVPKILYFGFLVTFIISAIDGLFTHAQFIEKIIALLWIPKYFP